MECDSEQYSGVYYSNVGTSYYPIQSVMVDFLNGDPNPMIAEINQEKYNHFSMFIWFDTNPSAETTQIYVNSLGTLIDQTPSMTHFDLNFNINSNQATQIATHLNNSNICYLSLESNQWTSDGMPELMSTLSHSNVQHLALQGPMSDATIAAMSFKDAPFESVLVGELNASQAGLVQLFQNFYGSPVQNFELFIQDSFSAETAQQIDFSQTNFTNLEFFGVNFEQGALANLSLPGSQINELRINFSSISGEHLKELSQSLQGSEVKTLSLELDDMANGDLAQLQLADTPVENLDLFYFRGFSDPTGFGSEIANLHLQDTNVKNLDLLGKITDKDLPLFNLKDTSVEHVDLHLDFNIPTEEGIALLQDCITGTHVKKVSYTLGHSWDYHTLLNDNMLGNDIVTTNAGTQLPALDISEIISVEHPYLGITSITASTPAATMDSTYTAPSATIVSSMTDHSSMTSHTTDPAKALPIAHNDPLSYVIDTLAGWL